VFYYSSDGYPNIIYSNKKKTMGKLFIDVGFLKLMNGYWDLAGIYLY